MRHPGIDYDRFEDFIHRHQDNLCKYEIIALTNDEEDPLLLVDEEKFFDYVLEL